MTRTGLRFTCRCERPVPRNGPTPTLALALLAALVPAVVSAQTRLTLAEAIERGLARNHDVTIQRENAALADVAADRLLGAYDLLLRVDARGRVRTDPFNSILSGAPAGALAPRTTAVLGGATISQLFSSGASLQASTSIERDTTNSRLALLTPSFLTSASIDFRQPLLQGRHVDPTRRAIRLAAVDRSRAGAALARTINETVFAVERAYWTLVSATRDVEVRRRSVALAERQRDDTRARIESGTAPESDLAAPTAEIERRRGDLFAAEEQVLRAEHALKSLVLDVVTDSLWNERIAAADDPAMLPRNPGIEAAVATAIANRPEIAEAKSGIARQDVEIDAARDRLRPSLDLVASYALRGLGGAENPDTIPIGGVPVVPPEDMLGNLWDSYTNLATHRFADASVGLSYTIPVGNRTAKADLAAAEIGRRQAQSLVAQVTQRVGVEVRNAVASLQTAEQRVQAAQAGREAAAIQLQAEQDRFDAGLTTSFFVLTRQNDLAQAELTEIAARTDYRRALADYLRATGTLLGERGIVLDTPAPHSQP
jgi:HAE1 family hydrophobic/amphiphilic exporter-1